VDVVVLVGLPGVGKTTVAQALAQQWDLNALDTDDVVATNVGMTVAQYLREEGESNFRSRELEALTTALEAPDVVIATGGGVVTLPLARQLLAGEFTIWLDCDDDVILTRLGETERPLLTEAPAATLARLRHERGEWYREVSRTRIDASAPLEVVVAQVTREVDRLTR
jgi:shikimate kinase